MLFLLLSIYFSPYFSQCTHPPFPINNSKTRPSAVSSLRSVLYIPPWGMLWNVLEILIARTKQCGLGERNLCNQRKADRGDWHGHFSADKSHLKGKKKSHLWLLGTWKCPSWTRFLKSVLSLQRGITQIVIFMDLFEQLDQKLAPAVLQLK